MMEKLLEQEAMMEEDQKVGCPSFLNFSPLPRFVGQEGTVDHSDHKVSRFHFHLPFPLFILSPDS